MTDPRPPAWPDAVGPGAVLPPGDRPAVSWLRAHGLAVVLSVVCVSGFLLVAVSALGMSQRPAPGAWQLAVVIGLCLVADRPLLEIRFGHQKESFTWAELGVVLGLFLVPVPVLVVVSAAGVLTYHAAMRREPVKVLFNATSFAIGVGLAGLAATLVGGFTAMPLGVRGTVALLVGALVFAVWNGLGVAVVVALSARTPFSQVYRTGLLLRGLISVGNAVAGVTVLLLASWSRPTLLVLPPLLLVLYSAYRGYLHAMQEREVWQQLEAATRELNVLEEREVARAALRRASQLFRPDAAELVVSGEPDGVGRLYTLDDDGALVVRDAAPQGNGRGTTAFLQLDTAGEVQPVVTCLSAPLEGPRGRVGALQLLFGGPARLSTRERQVLSTFAHAVSTTLLNAALYDDMRSEAALKAYEATHDHLTGLGNRSLLNTRKRAAIAESDGTTALLLLDLDHFKEINDTLGHAAGDVILQEVGRRLWVFSAQASLVARLGGDEFAVLLTGLSGPEEAEPVAEAVLSLLDEPVDFEGLLLSVEASLGVACHPHDADSAEELFRRADVAMYQAKTTRGQWLRYSADRDDSSVHRQALVAELRAALELDQIVVHYQPQVDLESGLLVGAEALCRWEHPVRGLLPPSEFVGVVEHSGLVRPFTLRVLDQAVAQCVLWQDQGRPVSVAVNLSARSLLDRQLPVDVATVLARHGLPPNRLVLEVTETMATSELEVVEEVLTSLRDLGVQLSVDDFGTGYSSLAFLQRTAVHELKVDRTFVSGMLQSENDLALVRATVQLARSLGARSVAEGVEEGAQAAALRDMGCDVAQGFWLSRPMPAAGMRALLGIRVTAEPIGKARTPCADAGLRVLRPLIAEGA